MVPSFCMRAKGHVLLTAYLTVAPSSCIGNDWRGPQIYCTGLAFQCCKYVSGRKPGARSAQLKPCTALLSSFAVQARLEEASSKLATHELEAADRSSQTHKLQSQVASLRALIEVRMCCTHLDPAPCHMALVA